MNRAARVAKELYNSLEDVSCDECPLEKACDLLNEEKENNICTKLCCEKENLENE